MAVDGRKVVRTIVPQPLVLAKGMQRPPILVADASAITFVSPNSISFLIFHGDADVVVPFQQSVILDQALKKAGVESTLKVIPGAGHGGSRSLYQQK